MSYSQRNDDSGSRDARSKKLWRIAGLIGGGLLALILALTLLQCSLKKPQAPTWESSVTVPLASDHFTIANLLLRLDNGDQFVDDSGNIGLLIVDTLAPVAIGTDFVIPNQISQLPQAVGQVRVDGPALAGVRVNLTDYYSGPAGSIPPIMMFDVDTIGPIQEFTWMAPAYGEMYLRVENQLGLAFDSINITVNDLVSGPLGTFRFSNGIAAGAADSQAIGIAGRQVHNQFRYLLTAFTRSGTLLSLSNRYFDVSMAFTDSLVIDSALMEIPTVTRSRTEAVGFTGNADVLSISRAEMESGNLAITVNNRTGLTAGVTVAVPSFTLGGVPLSRNLSLPAYDTAFMQVDLTGYVWVPEQTAAPQYFVVNAVASTVSTAPAHVLVRKQDSMFVTSRLDFAQARSVTGVIAPQNISLPAYSEALAIPPEFANFHLAEASLSIAVENGTGASADLAFAITGNNGKSLNLSGTALAGSPLAPVITTIVEPNLAAFLDPIPTQVDIASWASFGDSVSEVTVTAGDYASAIVTLSAPMSVRIDSVTIVGDVESQTISGTDVGEFTNNLLGGTLHLEALSHLPIGASVTLYVATDSLNVYSAPQLVLGPVSVAPGVTNIAGLVTDPVETVTDLVLTGADLQLFDSTSLYIGQHIHFDGTSGQTVQITNTDYLDLVAYFTVTMRNGGEVW